MATHDFAAHASHAHEAPQGFIRKWVFSLDHKVIGLQYYFLALAAVFVGMFLSLLMRIHLIWPGAAFADSRRESSRRRIHAGHHARARLWFSSCFTTAPQGGFGNYFLPIQIGAPDMAFPVFEHALVLDDPSRLQS